jgi:hypothetical protein
MIITITTRRALIENSMVAQLVKKFPAFYGTRRFTTMFTRTVTGPYPGPDESNPHFHTLFLSDPL